MLPRDFFNSDQPESFGNHNVPVGRVESPLFVGLLEHITGSNRQAKRWRAPLFVGLLEQANQLGRNPVGWRAPLNEGLLELDFNAARYAGGGEPPCLWGY